ncbi:BCLAF1 and THRAP3 family member 3 isoform X2 [Nerophis ophidion]|uniref:BCLAF1 and THRAP3 family member 3 isoform X2 n=1 Tax=Nerophis ophidion TaxID=159077 RepID=UPI002ADF8A18|nr:BCLAF1 and THRAP3 family member 3 isoform X2 [Nerophis ophidion]
MESKTVRMSHGCSCVTPWMQESRRELSEDEMSRPRSSSPQSRRLPWSGRGPYKPFAVHNMSRSDSSPTPRDENHWFRDGMMPEDLRRGSPSSLDHFWRHQDQDGCYGRRASPRNTMSRHAPGYFSQRDQGSSAERQRKGFREDMQDFNKREWSPSSPSRFQKERIAPNSRLDHSPTKAGWRRDERGQGDGRFRDASPNLRSDEQRGSRREKHIEGSYRSRPREDLHQERSPPWKKPRKDMDPQHHSGFKRDNKDFGERRNLPAFEGVHRGGPPLTDAHRSGPQTFDYDHNSSGNWRSPRREHMDHGDHGFNLHRQSGPSSSSQERFRTSNNKPDVREDSRRRPFADNSRDDYERKRSPPPQEWGKVTGVSRQDGQRGRGGPRHARGRLSHNQGRNFGPHKYRQNFQPSSRGFHGAAREEKRAGFRPQKEAHYTNAVEEEEQSWSEEDGHLGQNRPASLKPLLQRDSPVMARKLPGNEREEKKLKNMTVVTEETLTIKVDMSRPAHTSSTQCYSADHQLSLDLVNVGRQRLDFLASSAESSESRQEGVGGVKTATFAQEVITLVHHVKELYFKGQGITLNKRFSAPQKAPPVHSEDEAKMTLDKRFTSKHFNPKDLQDNNFSQPAYAPQGDLRYDLERRRQERVDGVTITIPGSGHQGEASTVQFGGEDVMFAEVQDFGWDANWGSRRGAPHRMNSGPPQRFKNLRPTQGQNHSNHAAAGPSW